MTKPIDWTRPLRLVGTHEPAQVVQIDPARDWPVQVRWKRAGSCETYRSLNSAGQALGDKGLTGPLVENVPAEPRIVERWAYAAPINDEDYRVIFLDCWWSERPKTPPPRGWRVARVLIEDPGEDPDEGPAFT